MQRVIERGWINDFYAAIRIYGGISSVKEIIKEIPSLTDKDMTFVCSVFDLFEEKSFDASSIEKHLFERYDFKGDFLERNTIKGSINDIFRSFPVE